ncbi:MAG: hypothetical protein K2O03_09185, partial [Lachnospiraceae bacterium]|nr:hypothetical protein [Lachnospiraceae bacterium]
VITCQGWKLKNKMLPSVTKTGHMGNKILPFASHSHMPFARQKSEKRTYPPAKLNNIFSTYDYLLQSH